MKHITICICMCSLLLSIGNVKAQINGGEVRHNPTNEPCLSADQYTFYTNAVSENQAMLDATGTRLFGQESAQVTNFAWPVAKADNSPYANIWAISNYVDHAVSTTVLEDWNCGTRTYDTDSGYNHQGLDIYTWPFWWKQMDNDESHVVAAAGGQIVYKNDGSYDRNCSFNNELWNAIYVEHSDGSVAWYGHMKNGSLTDKNVGDTVSEGEILGVIGSSGNSTGPHLHFEVYDENNNLIDPYVGACNDTVNTSWWQDQKSYTNPSINAALTHDAAPQFFSCPNTENDNLSNQFEPNASIIFAGYYIDQQVGTSATNEIFDPNGNLYTSWDIDFTDFYYSSYWYNTFTVNATEGEWLYRISYNGQTVDHTFNVGTLSVSEEASIILEAYPNPATDMVNISTVLPMQSARLYDVYGKLVKRYDDIINTSTSIDISELSSGMYFLSVSTQDGSSSSTQQIIKH